MTEGRNLVADREFVFKRTSIEQFLSQLQLDSLEKERRRNHVTESGTLDAGVENRLIGCVVEIDGDPS